MQVNLCLYKVVETCTVSFISVTEYLYAMSGKTWHLCSLPTKFHPNQNTRPNQISTDSKFVMNYKQRFRCLKLWSECTQNLYITPSSWADFLYMYTYVQSLPLQLTGFWFLACKVHYTHIFSTIKQRKIDFITIQNVNQTSFTRLNT